MKRLNATEARKELFRLLDAAERGEEVVVERKGVRFRLALEPAEPVAARPSPVIVEDPDVMAGNWRWVADEEGQLQFRPSGRRR